MMWVLWYKGGAPENKVTSPSLKKKHNLIYMKTNFNILATSITRLKTFRISLVDSINIIQKNNSWNLKSTKSNRKTRMQKTDILNTNKEFPINLIFWTVKRNTTKISDDFTVNGLKFFKYSSIALVDVERSLCC